MSRFSRLTDADVTDLREWARKTLRIKSRLPFDECCRIADPMVTNLVATFDACPVVSRLILAKAINRVL